MKMIVPLIYKQRLYDNCNKASYHQKDIKCCNLETSFLSKLDLSEYIN